MSEPGAIIKYSVMVAGHRTSISLEQAFWTLLRADAKGRGISVAALVSSVDSVRGAANLSSALRVHILDFATRLPDHCVASGSGTSGERMGSLGNTG